MKSKSELKRLEVQQGGMALGGFLKDGSAKLRRQAAAAGFDLTDAEADFLTVAGVLAGEESGLLKLSGPDTKAKLVKAAKFTADRVAMQSLVKKRAAAVTAPDLGGK